MSRVQDAIQGVLSPSLAGGIVLLIGTLRLTDRLAAWLPAPIVFGLLAGAVLPFVAGIFTGIGESPVLVGSTLMAYLLGQRFFGSRLTPVLPALVVGILVAGILGDLETGSGDFTWLAPEITVPAFSLEALATVTPVFVILITVQSNLASEVYLRKQGFQPPERAINVVSGLGTMAGSLFWALIFGAAISLLLERDKWQALQQEKSS